MSFPNLSPVEFDEGKLNDFKEESKWALKDFNFVFESGNVYSIVREHGSESRC